MNRRQLITIIFVLAALTANAQAVIEGTVLDGQGKVVDAYVTVGLKGAGSAEKQVDFNDVSLGLSLDILIYNKVS